MNQESRQENIELREKLLLRRIQALDQERYQLYQKRMVWQKKLEQVQAEKYRLREEEREVAGDE